MIEESLFFFYLFNKNSVLPSQMLEAEDISQEKYVPKKKLWADVLKTEIGVLVY